MWSMVLQLNKRVVNPVMLTMAGRRYWYAAAIQHVGRTSGRSYVTPVVARPCDGGFVIPLPYGAKVDWLRNVLAAGGATLRVNGEQHPVDHPEIVDAATALPLVDRDVARTWRLLGIERFLQLRTADARRAPTRTAATLRTAATPRTSVTARKPAPARKRPVSHTRTPARRRSPARTGVTTKADRPVRAVMLP